MAPKFVNSAIVMGRLGHDPELKVVNSTKVVRFSVANPTISKNGEETVQWHHISAFGKQAELCSQYLHKGDMCCVEGRVENREYIKDGEKKYYHSIVAERVTFLNSKRRTESPLEESLPQIPHSESVPF